jgi:hypothetical protein
MVAAVFRSLLPPPSAAADSGQGLLDDFARPAHGFSLNALAERLRLARS